MASGGATPQLNVIARTDDSVSWQLAGHGMLECVSHAVRDDDGRVWIFDPLSGAGLDAIVAELGGLVAGVVVLLDRHLRDAPAVAARLGVDLWFPQGRCRQELPPQTRRYDTKIDGCPFEFLVVRQKERAWLERAAWLPARRLLVVAEAVGTVGYYLVGRDIPLAVHPMSRIAPPKMLCGLGPDRVLVGHGPPVERHASIALETAIADGRRGIPRLLTHTPGLMLSMGKAGRAGRGGC